MELQKFKDLYIQDLGKEIDKDYKGLSYLSWATAYKLAMEADPSMTYEILEDSDGFPLFSRGDLHLVKTRVTMFGETKTMMLPVMDNKHNAVKNPDSRQINDNIMRCLAKNIAMFGIGLSLYTGEDTAQYRQENKPAPKNEWTKTYNKPQAPIEKPVAAKEKEVAKDDDFIPEMFSKNGEQAKVAYKNGEFKEVTFAEKWIGEEKAKQIREYLSEKHKKDGKAPEVIFSITSKFHLTDLKYLTVGDLEKLKEVKFDIEKLQ